MLAQLEFIQSEKQVDKSKTIDQHNNNIIHNYSTHLLTHNQENALIRGLEQHIPSTDDKIKIKTHFEQFYQQLLQDNFMLSEDQITEMKTTILKTYTNYNKVKSQYRFEKDIENLRKK